MKHPERETLEHLVYEHQESMRRLAIRLTGRLESADEIMQECMLRIVRSWSGFRGQSTFKTWATRVLLNVFHDWLAKQRPVAAMKDTSDPRQADPAACAMAEELRRYVAQRVSALPARQREVLVLMFYEGLEADEVAQLLEIQVSCVYANLYQARRRLRTELAPFLADSSCAVERS
jgi:RNA polymerase sigma-70 factor, ECF subfamily